MFNFSGIKKNPAEASKPQNKTQQQPRQDGLLAGTWGSIHPPQVNVQQSTGAVAGQDVSQPASSPVTAPPSSALQETFSTHPTQPEQFNDEQVANFKALFKTLEQSMGNADVVGQALRKIMVDLSQNPHYKEFMAPEDAGLMVRACRVSYGKAVTTRKANSRGRKAKTSIDLPDLGTDLGDILKDAQFS